MPRNSSPEDDEKRPMQERALKTEQALLDALEALLATRSFQDLTVSQIAAEAGVTTGAIYRRFKHKEDLLERAFARFLERTRTSAQANKELYAGMGDAQIVSEFLSETLRFTLANLPLMQAANSIQSGPSFALMREARALSARLLAELIQTSSFGQEELEMRCKFVLRIATAAYRDTFFSEPEAVRDVARYKEERGADIDLLLEGLLQMATAYLAIEGPLPKPSQKSECAAPS